MRRSWPGQLRPGQLRAELGEGLAWTWRQLSPSAMMTVVAAGMAVTAATATALAPIREADRGDQPPTAGGRGTADGRGPGTVGAAGAPQAAG